MGEPAGAPRDTGCRPTSAPCGIGVTLVAMFRHTNRLGLALVCLLAAVALAVCVGAGTTTPMSFAGGSPHAPVALVQLSVGPFSAGAAATRAPAPAIVSDAATRCAHDAAARAYVVACGLAQTSAAEARFPLRLRV
jgi:hypothetical protein